jgi:hypothetical protein
VDDEVTRRSGHDIVSNALQPVHTATTIRIRTGKMPTADSPCTETEEVLGRLRLIETSVLNNTISHPLPEPVITRKTRRTIV